MTDSPSMPERAEPARAPAHVYAAQRDWPAYFDAVAGKPARDTLLEALARFDGELVPGHSDAPPLAIDIGCGEGRDTAELLRRGWRVLAIDGHTDAIRRMREREDLVHTERLEVRHEPFEALTLPRATLVNASFALPFCPPERFDDLWSAIVDAIEPGGRFAGQLFGDRDDWASIADRTHHTRSAAERLLGPFEVELFTESEDDGKDALQNPKYWHRFDIVARKAHAGKGRA